MIPLLDLQAQYRGIKDEIDAAVAAVLASGRYVLGPEVEALEAEFAAYCGAPHAVAVNSGTSALHLALRAAGVGPGDEVITVPQTFVATVAAVCYTGARPVLVDIDPVSYTMDVNQLADAVTERTRAILPVHLYGQPADLDPILEIAQAHGLAVIEDAAQAHGAGYRGRRAGGSGDLGCFSFYPGKNLGACGEGGMVLARDARHARTVRMLRDWGQERKHHHELNGYNARMDAIQGAILRVKLRRLEAWTEARRARAREYDRTLQGIGLQLPAELPDRRHVYHVYPVLVPAQHRDAILAHLNEEGIGAGVHYPYGVHELPAYADLGYARGRFPQAERVARSELSLPIYPELSGEQQRRVVDSLRALMARLA